LKYSTCIACRKGWVSPASAKQRVTAATKALQYRPNPEDWRDIRWSDEAHFCLSPEGRPRIKRKPGERYCPDCILHQDPAETKGPDREHLHVWAAVGYNFKSDLHFYTIPTNKNGKMSSQVYRDQILEPVIGAWLARGNKFILEEDNNSEHGTGQKPNIVRTWKEEHGLKYFFNTHGSPNLVPIENCWRDDKQYIRARRHYDSDLRQLIIKGWETVKQETINERVDSMVVRMQDVIANKGQMTKW